MGISVSEFSNNLGQPIGFPTEQWSGCEHPRGAVMKGRLCRLEPIDAERHCADLFAAFCLDLDARNWTYLPYGPFATEAEALVDARGQDGGEVWEGDCPRCGPFHLRAEAPGERPDYACPRCNRGDGVTLASEATLADAREGA